MNRYEILMKQLDETGEGNMTCRGNSMLPILTNPSLCFYRREEVYQVGDIVFCKVKGRFIDAHIIKAVEGGRYLIGNNHGYDNGWTRTIYGRVVSAYAKGDNHMSPHYRSTR